MERRRRRTDRLPLTEQLPADPLARARVACDHAAAIGFESVVAMHVPDDGSQGVVSGAAGRAEPLVDVARGIARRALHDGRPLQLVDTEDRIGARRWRHAAVPIGRVAGGTLVLVASDPNLSQREGQALATWVAPATTAGMTVRGGPCASLARGLANEFDADAVVLALFASSGILLNMHVRSGGLLHSARVPSDTVWGEVARHGAAFTLGDLPLHSGVELLASVGMRNAALVGLENGNGIAIGALGVASAGELDVDVAHHLLARAPVIGPDIMTRLSSTQVPVPAADGSVDLHLLAARVGCERFVMYELVDTEPQLIAAHARDGSRAVDTADELEKQLVGWAARKGVGVVSDDAAAVLIGDHTVLYARDGNKRALDCLRLALQDVRRNPFGGEDDSVDADAA